MAQIEDAPRSSTDHRRVFSNADSTRRPLAFPSRGSMGSTRPQAPPPSHNPFLTLHPADPFEDRSPYTPSSAPSAQLRFPEFADISPPSPTSSLRPRLRINTMTSASTSSTPRPHFPHASIDGPAFASRSTTFLPMSKGSIVPPAELLSQPTRSGFKTWARNIFSSRSRAVSNSSRSPPPPERRARPPKDPLPSFPPPPAHRTQSYVGTEKVMAGDNRYTVWQAPSIIVSRG